MIIKWSGLGLLAAVLVVAGCGKKGAQDFAPPTETQVVDLFKTAPAEVRAVVTDASAALAAGQSPKALALLSAVRTRQDLTPEQHAAIRDLLDQVIQKLGAAAAAGDQEAQGLIKSYGSGR
ncbi:MAG TPA: hypothetical protein VMF06_06030 [Candidatus Limnocylindria bacterium]|jgi:hypothetical protein|nr:hypothetical protein [Candidatus Limnocylindria bacterium]